MKRQGDALDLRPVIACFHAISCMTQTAASRMCVSMVSSVDAVATPLAELLAQVAQLQLHRLLIVMNAYKTLC